MWCSATSQYGATPSSSSSSALPGTNVGAASLIDAPFGQSTIADGNTQQNNNFAHSNNNSNSVGMTDFTSHYPGGSYRSAFPGTTPVQSQQQLQQHHLKLTHQQNLSAFPVQQHQHQQQRCQSTTSAVGLGTDLGKAKGLLCCLFEEANQSMHSDSGHFKNRARILHCSTS